MTLVLPRVVPVGLGLREDNVGHDYLINIFIYEKYMNNIWSRLNKFLTLEKARIK
jgi:hypothetical protein